MALELERRDQLATVRLHAGDSGPVLRGTAIVYNSLSSDLGGFREIITPGAARGALNSGRIVATFNHNPHAPLARQGAGLNLFEDERGVHYTIVLPDTQVGRDVAELVGRGVLAGSSFTFHSARERWTRDANGNHVRTLSGFEVVELGPVLTPAYGETTVAMRSLVRVSRAREFVPLIYML